MFILVSMKSDEFVRVGPTGISNIVVQSLVVMVSVPNIGHAKPVKSAKKDVAEKHTTEVHVLLVSIAQAGLPGLHGLPVASLVERVNRQEPEHVLMATLAM